MILIFFLNASLEATGGNAKLKLCTFDKFLELKGQGDPISAYLFILALEILFSFIKNDSSMKGMEVFDYVFLYMVYANDSTFFLKDLASVKKLLHTFSCY